MIWGLNLFSCNMICKYILHLWIWHTYKIIYFIYSFIICGMPIIPAMCLFVCYFIFHCISLSTELCVDGCRRTNKQETVHWKLFLPLFILTKLHNAPSTQWNQSSFTFDFFESSSTHLTIYLFSHNPSSLPISSDLSSHGSIFSHIHLLPSSCFLLVHSFFLFSSFSVAPVINTRSPPLSFPTCLLYGRHCLLLPAHWIILKDHGARMCVRVTLISISADNKTLCWYLPLFMFTETHDCMHLV